MRPRSPKHCGKVPRLLVLFGVDPGEASIVGSVFSLAQLPKRAKFGQAALMFNALSDMCRVKSK